MENFLIFKVTFILTVNQKETKEIIPSRLRDHQSHFICNNNMNNSNTDSLPDLPRPSFSGTIGLDNSSNNNDVNNNNSSSSNHDGRNNIKRNELLDDRYNVGQDSKRRRYAETNTFGYYNYDNTNNIDSSNSVKYSQFYGPPNSFYNQPYVYSTMNQSYQYFPNNYGQSYYQGYPTSIDSIQQQSHMAYSQQINSYHNNYSIDPPSNSTNLISYKDIYSNDMVQQMKSTKKSKKNKLNKSNNNNNNKQVLSVTSTTSYSIPNQPIRKKMDVKEAKSFKKETYDAKDDLLQVKNKPEEDDDNSDSGEEDFNGECIINDKIDESDDLDTYSDKTKWTTIPVPGTSITLVTDEDIAKWREERKKMWLLKISNRKEQHMEAMGIKKEDLNSMGSILRESKKERQFIQNIQNQVNRFNPKVSLNLKFVQKEMLHDNTKLLSFIKELGDAGLLEYELTEKEKKVLFGNNQDENNKQNSHKNIGNKKLDKVNNKKTINNNNSRTGSISNNNIKKNYREYKK